MPQFPVVYFENNLVFNMRKEAHAVYKIRPFTYEYLSRDKKINMLWQLHKLFWVVREDGQILGIPRSFSIKEHHENLKSKVQGPTREIFERHCDMTASYLEQVGSQAGDYQFYLVIKLRQPTQEEFWKDLKSYFTSLIRDPIRFIHEQAGVAIPEFFAHEIEAYMSIEEQLFNRVNTAIRVDRVDEKEIEWLIRRNFWRAIAEPPVRKNWVPASEVESNEEGKLVIRPLHSEIITLTEGEVRLENPRRVEITQVHNGEEKKSYQIFAAVSEIPADLSFPGCEYLYLLQDIGFPVEFSIKFDTITHREALAELRKKKLEIKDQTSHTASSGDDLPIDLMESNDQAIELEDDLKKRRPPLVHVSISFCVAADDLKVAQERVQHLKHHYDDLQFQIEIPTGDQWKLFNEFIPGSPRMLDHYVHRLTPEYVAGGMFGAINDLGDNQGCYIGTTGILNRPVYLDPSLAPKLNKTASIAFLGTLGGGKSFTANLITYLAVLQGAKALVIDPKGERSNWANDLPELHEMINIITLANTDEDTGKLDAFSVCDDRKDANYLAVNILCYLANTKHNKDEELAIMEAVQRVAEGPNPCMTKVIEQLEKDGQESPEALRLYRLFKHYSQLPYANLLFGTGKENAISLKTAMNILQLQNINLPEPGKSRDDYNFDETISMSIMMAIAAFATKFTQQDRGIFKITYMDEAWALLGSDMGRALADKLIRMGRAMNNAIYLITQSAKDLLDESIKNNIGVKFVFRSTDAKELTNILQFLNLEDTEKNRSTIRTLDNGTALMQDLDGRIGVVRIDAVFEHLMKAFDTRPMAQKAKEIERQAS